MKHTPIRSKNPQAVQFSFTAHVGATRLKGTPEEPFVLY